jgi:putative membrane protein
MNPSAMNPSSTPKPLIAVGVIWLVGLLLSGWSPFDRTTWWLEVFPCFIGFAVMWASRNKFPLTNLLYVLILIHGLILMLGGAYSYARVPLGFWMQDWFGFARNNYDKIGHFAQGFIPAIIARELLIRKWKIPQRGLVAFLAISICLAFSAFYELIEWWAALGLGQGADEFLGTQGDPWDTQSDMFMALIGASVAVAALGRWHDQQMSSLAQRLETTSA